MLRPADSLPAVPICPGKSPSTGHFCCPSYAHRALIFHAPIAHALLAHASRRTALTSAEMSPARESGSGRPAGQWNTAGLWNATGAWNTLGAWNIAVRTRGVFTHRDDFQKPACVERGLVRTARGWRGLEGAGGRGSAARPSDGNRRGRKMVARDEQKRMADMAAWGNVLGVTMRATERSRRKDGR